MNVASSSSGLSSIKPSASIISVQDDIVRIRLSAEDGVHLVKNEVIYVVPSKENNVFLKAEILRVFGREADAQVFEETNGIAVGDSVLQTAQMLSVELGPGLLGNVYDGLQNPLESLAAEYGFYLPRGVDIGALSTQKEWHFNPTAKLGSLVKAGDVLGFVQEGAFAHKIMVPFDAQGEYELVWIQSGKSTVNEKVARLTSTKNESQLEVGLMQRWPVRKALPEYLLKNGFSERKVPSEPLITTLRLVDTFFPVAKGGTGCIPGPFGAGKTVLQNLISRYSNVDIVIVVACGERAGEVVETITEFPKLVDPVRGGPLMDRTIIICNTSSMPVAAREASIYTGVTIGEYYRQMGYNVLLIADSTSRWAQAMRETSGRMEEIPGEEAFPAYLDSTIKNIYERAGVINNSEKLDGSLTMIGTVSPAGGNFEEPVTQSTLATVKTFLGLSAERAYRRFYPAVDPIISWSRYLKQLEPWYEKNLSEDWVARVEILQALLRRGQDIEQMMQVTGEEGVTLEDYIIFQKAMLVDMVYLQQDAFDDVDVSVSLERQQVSLDLLNWIVQSEFKLATLNDVRSFFTEVTHLYKNLNYAPYHSAAYEQYGDEIKKLVEESAKSTD